MAAATALLGWATGSRALTQILPGAPVTTPLTAVLLGLFSASVLSSARRASVSQLLAGIAGVIALFVLTQYAAGWGPSIETLLFRDGVQALGGRYPGRPSPHTAVAAAALAFALITWPLTRGRGASLWLALLAMAIPWVALFGYASATNPFFEMPSSPETGMSPLTASALLLVGVGLIGSQPDEGLPMVLRSATAGGTLARRVLPLALGAPLLLSWLVTYGTRWSPESTGSGIALSWGLASVTLAALIVGASLRLHQSEIDLQSASNAVRAFNATLQARVEEMTLDLQVRAATLEEKNRELEEFAFVASHDLKSPLRRIAGFVQLLARRYRGQLSPEADGWIERSVGETRKMEAMIDGVLAYARLDAAPAADTPFPLDAVLDEALLGQEEALADATVERSALPMVRGDRTRLVQVMENLLANAARFRSDAPLVIGIAGTARQDDVLITFRDNGIGVPEKSRTKIFEMFRRAEVTDAPGTGIGLAICRRVVQRHGGEIWVEPNPGGGSTFAFTLSRMPPGLGPASLPPEGRPIDEREQGG